MPRFNVRASTLASVSLLSVPILMLAVGLTLGLPLALLVLAASALAVVIGLLWSSVQSLTGETPLSLDEAIGLGAPSAEEEQKRAVLRALKDMEYERSVGKISEDDFRELSARYRAEARRLISTLDESLGPARRLAEELVEGRLAQAGLREKTSADQTDGPAETDQTDEVPASEEAAPDRQAEARLKCPACDTDNDLDARFCKACAASLETEAVEGDP